MPAPSETHAAGAAGDGQPADHDLYRRLQAHLDRMPVGFPATTSGVEIRILRRLFTPDDAALALALSAIAESPATVHRRVRARYSRPQLDAALASMAARGLILRIGRSRPRYGKYPFVVGIYEAQLTRMTADLERDILAYFEEALGKSLHTTKTTQLRTVPVNVRVDVDSDVATYDDIRAYVRATDGPFAAMKCICREGKSLVGHACHQTTRQETCLTFGSAARGVVESGAARFVDKAEMLQLLDDADRDGLVLQPSNTQAPLFVCCCCGCCCGVLTTAKRLPDPATYFSANYYAEADAGRCVACGACVDRCPMGAISLDTGRAVVARTHCIGCALCATACASDALAMQKKDAPRVPPKTLPALYAQIYRERYGTLGLASAAARRLLGIKV